MDLSLILVFVLAAVVVYATTLWKKISKLEEGLRTETRALEERREELEKARKEARERRDEAEETKKLLIEARNKLKKKDKDSSSEASQTPKKAKADKEEAGAAPSPVIVRISDQELAAEHQRAVQKLEDELAAVRSELASAKKREENRAREQERAAKALEAAAAAPAAEQAPAAPAPAPAVSASEEVDALRAQLDAIKKAAVDRERELKREIRKAQDDAKHALRRAANNQALYAVLKGQLELEQDRLAAYKLKYEGAKSMDELRREAQKNRPKKQRNQQRGQNGEADVGDVATVGNVGEMGGESGPAEVAQATSEPPANVEGAPSTIEVAKEDIVSTHPVPASELPEPAKPGA